MPIRVLQLVIWAVRPVHLFVRQWTIAPTIGGMERMPQPQKSYIEIAHQIIEQSLEPISAAELLLRVQVIQPINS